MEHELKLTMISLKRLAFFKAEKRHCRRVRCRRGCVTVTGCVTVVGALSSQNITHNNNHICIKASDHVGIKKYISSP